ncbi:hypothetical protein GJ698_01980 [Pseudoduganella sp. FT26W]|uniref:AlgX/AlgJ SGNH hydrolase-like domain-containing protein n=1 Tax=Duganella aquatilis TaxID=2666082 RepID=A0A844D6N1_9BURK|nr:hypothetical protein [Duganella aquatilis]MRW82859.1 hypothetical protein [Duganella aquatilis]
MARKLNALLFLLLTASGCGALLWRLFQQPAPPRGGWLDGGITTALDQQIRRAMPASGALDQRLNGLLYAVTGDTGPQVRAGCDGWLFLAEETAATPHGDANFHQRLRLATLLQATLAQRGVALVSLPIPDKVELAHAQLCGLPVSAQARSRSQAWRAASGGIPLAAWVDLHEGWPAPGYWRTDTHWDRSGAGFAALRVAGAVRKLVPAGDTAMHETVAAAPSQRVGDLARLAGLAHNAPPFGPPQEYDRIRTLEIERGGSLLDEVAPPRVLLAGSSYSLNSGFADALQLALRQEVSQQSRTGSGFAGSLLEVLAHPQRLDGVAVVVWEWPLRALYQPLTTEETDWLQLHQS